MVNFLKIQILKLLFDNWFIIRQLSSIRSVPGTSVFNHQNNRIDPVYQLTR